MITGGADSWVPTSATSSFKRAGTCCASITHHRDAFKYPSPSNLGSISRRRCNSIHCEVPGTVDAVLHFRVACEPAGLPEGSHPDHEGWFAGNHNALGLALHKKAKFFRPPHRRCYGDPTVSPQPETYWGNVNCVVPSACMTKRDDSRRPSPWPTHHAPRRGYASGAHIQYQRAAKRLNEAARCPTFSIKLGRREPITVYGDGKQRTTFGSVPT